MQKPVDIKAWDPTEAQRLSIESVNESAAIVAAAGSGKTRVLIERIIRAIGEEWSELDRILAITFTEKAAAEIKTRLRQRIPVRQRHRLENAWIGTFHACCARMLRQHAPLISLDPSFNIIDNNAAGLVLRQVVRTKLLHLIEAKDPATLALIDALDFKNTMGVLEELMEFRWHAKRALALQTTNATDEQEILEALVSTYPRIEEFYLEELANQGALDFQELEIRALDLLSNHPDILEGYRKRFSHILVDEFQDTSDVQTSLVLTLFSSHHNRLLIVGDPRQSIYRFRGANLDCFALAVQKIKKCDGKVIHLAHNFRSQPEIVSFINECQESLAEGLFGKLSDDGIIPSSEGMIASRNLNIAGSVISIPIDIPVGTSTAGRRKAEASNIATFIAEIVGRGEASFGDIVCLFQTLTGASSYEVAFRQTNIPCRFYGGLGFLGRQEISDLLAALYWAANPHDKISLLALLRGPLIGLSDDDLVELAGPDGKNLPLAVLTDHRCRLLNDIQQMSLSLRPSEMIKEVLSLTNYERICDALDPSGGATANIERLVALAASIERQEPMPLADFAGFLMELEEHSARLADPPAEADDTDTVRCMTVHAAKGLEFPIVILPDLFRSPPQTGRTWKFVRGKGIAFKLKDRTRPFATRRESEHYTHLKESEALAAKAELMRLLYVAMTRAREIIAFPVHRGMKKEGPWQQWLLPIIDKSIARNEVRVWYPSKKSKDDFSVSKFEIRNPVSVSQMSKLNPKTSTFTVSQLECYDRCPQEYFLKYDLCLPARNIMQDNTKGLTANVFGSIVHGVLKRFATSQNEELTSIIKTECIACGIFPDEESTNIIKHAIDSALQLPIISKLLEGEREIHFDWRVGDKIITGAIDWLIPKNNGYEIVDFKTDDVEKERIPERATYYDLQMVCYALAIKAATGKEVLATTIAFLKPKAIHTTQMNQHRQEQGSEKISSIISSITKKNFSIQGIPPCITCPYHHNGMCWEDRLTHR